MSANLKNDIQNKIKQFNSQNLKNVTVELLNLLGYNSERTIDLKNKSSQDFIEYLEENKIKLNETKAKIVDWLYVDFIFQLTDAEIREIGTIFNENKIENTIIESYLFMAIELKNNDYTRTELAGIIREVNRHFSMPIFIIFKYGDNITFGIINRRLNKKDASKDVLEKITLIKDININEPHRAHIEILFDLSLTELQNKYQINSFVTLHKAWQDTLDLEKLNKRFYTELANWYFWASKHVLFPGGNDIVKEAHISKNLIRFLTRIIFVWFMKEKKLIPNQLFNLNTLKDILIFTDKTESTFYKAILQNLFFATLNVPMKDEKNKGRIFIDDAKKYGYLNDGYLQSGYYRYSRFIKNKNNFLKLFENIPFLNGGLFDCIDKSATDRIDCFSDNPKNEDLLIFPDYLFFNDEKQTDELNDIFCTKGKTYKVKGLINILNHYKFTIAENTPIEEEIALDPELLGRVFENLLASYNPETQTTARKQTGSFYTPRKIVDYMVDESLIAYLTSKLSLVSGNKDECESIVRSLFSYSDIELTLDDQFKLKAIEAIESCKILDPACGSGAFPMGVLHKMTFLLHKLDPENIVWKNRLIEKVPAELREETKKTLANKTADYIRKLGLIENCIYGVDIQEIAIQITKLRFFISLLVEQKVDDTKPNRDIKSLPNLETKFVAANTLIGLNTKNERVEEIKLPNIEKIENELIKIREEIFYANSREQKKKLQKDEQKLREKLKHELKDNNFLESDAEKIADWDPFDLNVTCDWFDPKWMFGVVDGFDIIVGNPPYISFYSGHRQLIGNDIYKYFINNYEFITEKKAKNRISTIMLFLEKAYKLCKINALVWFIIDIGFNSDAYKYIRKYLIENVTIFRLIKNINSFENVLSGQVILSFINRKTKNSYFRIYNDIDDSLPQIVDQSEIVKDKLFQLNISMYKDIISKIEEGSEIISEVAILKSGMNIGGVKDFFVSNERKNDKYHIAVYSGNVFPFQLKFDNYKNAKNKKYITFDKELEKYILKNKLGTPGIGENEERFKKEKIFLRRALQSSGKLVAAYSNNPDEYCDVTVYVINKKNIDLLYLLGIINSTLLSYYCKQKGIIRAEAGQQPQITINRFKEFPVKINKHYLNSIVGTVDLIHFCIKNNIINSQLVKLLDAVIYELYLDNYIVKLYNVREHLTFFDNYSVSSSSDEKKQLINYINRLVLDKKANLHASINEIFGLNEVRNIHEKYKNNG